MASITFNGHDLSDLTTAEVLMCGGQSFAVTSTVVPGSPKRVIEAVEFEPFRIQVKLMLKTLTATNDRVLSALRRRLRAALTVYDLEGGTLTLPDEPGLSWHGVYAVDVDTWDTLFEDGSCTVTFESYDPIAYGAGAGATSTVLGATGCALDVNVGGNFDTWPTFCATALAGSALELSDDVSGRVLRIEREFVSGDAVVIDAQHQSVSVGDADVSASVTLASDFFALAPGKHHLALEGASKFTVEFTERWI